MNKKLHIFLFLFLGLIIFCALKDIEPFGNQVLLQPGLSFDSRDTYVSKIKYDTTNSIKILPSMEENNNLSYSSFEINNSNDINNNLKSSEEIELLNDRLDNLQYKLDKQDELFLSEGGKRKCTIPRGINGYQIKKTESDGVNRVFNVEQGQRFDYDYFSELEINCVDLEGIINGEGNPTITCPDDEDEFVLSGCKRKCRIPEGYIIQDSANGNEYYSDDPDPYNYDKFESNIDNIRCDSYEGYIGENIFLDYSTVVCSEDKDEFSLSGCEQFRRCNISEGEIQEGYLLDNAMVNPGEFEFNPFNNALITTEAIRCDQSNNYFKEDIQIEPTITCDDDGDVLFSGCKRHCSIPRGYKIIKGDDTYYLRAPFDLDEGEVRCTTNYYTEERSKSPYSTPEAAPECGEDETTFNFQGCEEQGYRPLVVDFSVESSRVCDFQLEDGYRFSNGESYEPGSYRYNYFNNVNVECTDGFEIENPNELPKITCPADGDGRFIFQGCIEV